MNEGKAEIKFRLFFFVRKNRSFFLQILEEWAFGRLSSLENCRPERVASSNLASSAIDFRRAGRVVYGACLENKRV